MQFIPIALVPMLIIARQNRYLRRFEAAGATAATAARPLSEIGVRDGHVLRLLERRGVIVALPDGAYYMAPAAKDEFLARRRKAALIAMALAATALAIGLAIGGLQS